MKKRLGILFLLLLTVLLVASGSYFWRTAKLPTRVFTKSESPRVVARRPIFVESYPESWLSYGEYECAKTNIYVTNQFGIREKIFTDATYKGDEMTLFVLSPDRQHAVAAFGNQTCGGKDQEYSYFEYIDLFEGTTKPIIGKENDLLFLSGNMQFSPDSTRVAFFNNNALYMFDSESGMSRKVAQLPEVQAASVYDTNEDAQKSPIVYSPFVTFVGLPDGKWAYIPERKLAWKDNTTVYYYVDLYHNPQDFYKVTIDGEASKLEEYTYPAFDQLKEQGKNHQLGVTEYPIRLPEVYEQYRKKYCTEAEHYSMCQL